MKQSRVLTYLILAVLSFLLREPFYEMWSGWEPIARLTVIESSRWNDLAALTLVVLGVPGMVVMAGRLSEMGNRWAMSISGCVLYMTIVLRVCYGYGYTPFSSLPWLKYADVLIPVMGALWMAAFLATQKQSKHTVVENVRTDRLFYDDSDEFDFLGRTKLVTDIFDRLNKEQGNEHGARGVSVTGGWGTGKSWVLCQLKRLLQENGDICIDFRPWLYGEVDIARNFYMNLERQLRLHGLNVEELKNAVTEIDNDEMVGFGRAFLSLFGIITKGRGREETVERIRKKLRQAERPIYIFIDDCDRLAQKELVQVLSLVRNTGDFPGLTYIMAFDKEVVEKIIGKETGVGYVEKMFNLPIDLPPVNDDVIADYLNEAAGKALDCQEEKFDPYRKIKVTRYLPTVREAKRYLNLLITDYKRNKERFDKYFLNMEDFCLIELLKYWKPEAYYTLQATPRTYVGFVKGYWNSPAGLPIREHFTEGSDLKNLIQAMFRPVKDPIDWYGLIGIANEEYFPLYFEKEPGGWYVNSEEYKEALERAIIPQKIDEWLHDGCKGVMALLCVGYRAMSRRDVFLAMAKYLWNKCEATEPGNTMDEMAFGYRQNTKHGFRNIMRMIEETPQISLLTFQRITDQNEDVDGVENLIDEKGYLLELMGIWLKQLREVNHTDYPYDEVTYYIGKIWDKQLECIKEEDDDTLNMLDILEACTLEPTFSKMVMPLVKNDPQRWLGATVLKLSDGGKEYYLLKSRGIHALFGSLEMMYDEMKILVNTAKDENKQYVEAYQRLIYGLAAITVNKKDANIPDKYKQPESLAVSAFPELAASKILGIGAAMPLEAALKQMTETDFWKGKDLRVHREAPGLYFGTEI